jgi:transcriptional regulator with XRE-family HTH domain
MKWFNFTVDPKAVRTKLGLNQQEFWTKIGVTQSGGSRYESGRAMPKPVRELLRLVHIEKLDLSRVRKEDFEVIEYLKSSRPDLYRSLRKAAKANRQGTNDVAH